MKGVLSKHTMTARARLRHPDDEVTAAYKVGTNTLRYSNLRAKLTYTLASWI